VRVEGETHDLVDEPVSIAIGQQGPQAFLELRAQLPVDVLDESVDGVHPDRLSRNAEAPGR